MRYQCGEIFAKLGDRVSAECRAILEEICLVAQPGAFWWEPGVIAAKGRHRASMRFQVAHRLVDAFEATYRATYESGAWNGECLNRAYVDALAPIIRSAAVSAGHPPQELVERSLAGSQAKIWLDENERDSGVAVTLEVKGGWIDDATGELWDNPLKRNRSWKLARSEDP